MRTIDNLRSNDKSDLSYVIGFVEIKEKLLSMQMIKIKIEMPK